MSGFLLDTNVLSEFKRRILSAQSFDRGKPLPNIDGVIAATALEHDLTLVTRNVKDFGGLGLTLLNPWET